MSDLVQIVGLTKSYSGVRALDYVSLDLNAGEVHALCGENGAGKSTLIKCLAGVTVPDSGCVEISGRMLRFGSVGDSEAAGVAVIHQEATTFPDLDTVDNVFVGRELTNRFGLLDRSRMNRETHRLLDLLGQHFDVRKPVGELSLANRQMVSMARALSRKCKLLIMDEPTASLSLHETDALIKTVKRLRTQGVAILYVSHRLSEVFELADTVSVLRDGKLVASQQRSELTEAELIRQMVGRDAVATDKASSSARAFGDTKLEVHGLSGQGFASVSLSVRAGEIVGVAGLVGAGRSELAKAIVGIDRYDAGQVLVDDRVLPAGKVCAALDAGVALVPEDRQHEGLVLPMNVRENMTMAVLPTQARYGLIDRTAERHLVQELIERLRVKTVDAEVSMKSLSGGNQQKVVLAKWLARKPGVLILDEPTRGVDVGAKAQVHALVRELAAEGMATLLISSDLPELIAMCDRVLVMREGKISGELPANATQEEVLALALPQAVGRS